MDTHIGITGADTTDPVARARALRPLLEASAAYCDNGRELAPAVVEAIHAAGLFRLLIPRELGGAQTDLATFVQVIEALGEADGSTAWCVGQNAGCSLTSAYLPHDAGMAVFGADPRAVVGWGAGVNGRAVQVPGGWRVSGGWSYASGSRHCNWLGGLTPLHSAEGAPLSEPDGSPLVRSVIFPKSAARITDDWQTMGLRGTGSDSYAVEDVFVPVAHCFLRFVPPSRPGTLYRFTPGHVYPIAFAGVALGIARAVLDEFLALASGKTPRGGRKMRDNAAIQSIIGHNEVRLRAARSFLLQSIREIWADLEAGAPFSDSHALSIRMCTTFAIQESMAVVDVAFHEAGATAIHSGNPFERRFRDLHAVSQQVQSRRANFELVGMALLGVPTGPLFL